MTTAEKFAQMAMQNRATFKVGDIVQCIKDVAFTNGSYHYRGETYKVTSKNLAYFNTCYKNYMLVDVYKFEEKIRQASHLFVKKVIKQVEKLAKRGYGSADIAIDGNFDYHLQFENPLPYSRMIVVELLQQEGFKLAFKEIEPRNEVMLYTLYWQIPYVEKQYSLKEPDWQEIAERERLAREEWERVRLPKAPQKIRCLL